LQTRVHRNHNSCRWYWDLSLKAPRHCTLISGSLAVEACFLRCRAAASILRENRGEVSATYLRTVCLAAPDFSRRHGHGVTSGFQRTSKWEPSQTARMQRGQGAAPVLFCLGDSRFGEHSMLEIARKAIYRQATKDPAGGPSTPSLA